MVSVDIKHQVYLLMASITELRNCVSMEVGLGFHSLFHSFPVPNKQYGFYGRKAP